MTNRVNFSFAVHYRLLSSYLLTSYLDVQLRYHSVYAKNGPITTKYIRVIYLFPSLPTLQYLRGSIHVFQSGQHQNCGWEMLGGNLFSFFFFLGGNLFIFFDVSSILKFYSQIITVSLFM